VPWFAIGGIDPDSAELAVGAGATRLAAVRAIADAPDPERAARSLRTVLERAHVAVR
jgi:thiamine-phosphate pyrophosphorylase